MEEKKKSKKGLIIGLIIGATLLFIAAIVFLILFLFKPTYKITVNTNGKKLIKDIVVKDKTIKELPEIELNENEYLVAWVNEDGEAIRVGLPIEKGPISPVIGDPEKEKVTISFDTGTGEVLDSITINKGSGIILPVKPKNYEDWKFLYWVDKNEYLVIIGTPLYEDLTVYAYWWKPGAGGTSKETVKISFDTGTDEKLDDIKVPVGNKYIFRTPEKQNGDKIFKGWLDDKGNLLDENSIVEKAITLKAKWVEPYTCPEDCTPNEDGKTCTRKTERDMEHSSECIDPYEIVNGKCLDTQNGFSAFYEHDGVCPAGYYQWDNCFAGGCDISCAREVGFESGSWCPDGYAEENGKCVRTETVECTAN